MGSATAFTRHAEDDIVDPLELGDLGKGVVVPRSGFEPWLQKHDWTYHQVARGEFPEPYTSLADFQLACICSDPYLWCRSFLREPEDADHDTPYRFFPYQIESLRYDGSCIHKDASEVGKTREIVAWCLWKSFCTPNGSGLIGAPLQTHLEEIIEAMYDQMTWAPYLRTSLVRWRKHPHHAFYFSNRFKIDFRPSGNDGIAYRGVHARTFAIKDEAAKDKNKRQWSEFWRAIKPGCSARIYSVPDGDRSCEFYKLGERAAGKTQEVEDGSLAAHIKKLKFRLFQWPKSNMPSPFWTPERKRFYIEQFGGEDSPEYKHNVLGVDGDPEDTVFPWHLFRLCIKDIPQYRCLKVLADSHNNEVIVSGYRCEIAEGADIAPKQVMMIDSTYRSSAFFALDDVGESEFRRLIRSFFVYVEGRKVGGADLGYMGDPTEIIIKSIYGKRERTIARLQLKHVTYDQQCQAIDALDDLYDPEDISWGTDFGNAGSAVAHDLYGLPQYADKNYEDRLRGFMFGSTTDDIDENGEPLIDAKTEKPIKVTFKELATDFLVKKMQHQELEYAPDPDFIFFYPNHTSRHGERHRIFKERDDHLIDADRLQKLAQIMAMEGEDIFA